MGETVWWGFAGSARGFRKESAVETGLFRNDRFEPFAPEARQRPALPVGVVAAGDRQGNARDGRFAARNVQRSKRRPDAAPPVEVVLLVRLTSSRRIPQFKAGPPIRREQRG